MPVITAEVNLTFIRGGVAAKSGKPYCQVSNGRKEFFLNLKKDFDASVFEKYSENDSITCEVELVVGSDSVTLLNVLD